MDSDPKSYKFMKETIKKEPPDRKKWLIRCLLFLCAAVLFGLIAAVTFVVTEPKISAALNGTEKVDIPTDEEPEPDGNAAADPEASSTPTPTPAPTEEPDEEITLEDYENLYKEMLAVAETPKRALVTVIGITNQMDYFHQNYENQQQITGLIVAEEGQDRVQMTSQRTRAKRMKVASSTRAKRKNPALARRLCPWEVEGGTRPVRRRSFSPGERGRRATRRNCQIRKRRNTTVTACPTGVARKLTKVKNIILR